MKRILPACAFAFATGAGLAQAGDPPRLRAQLWQDDAPTQRAQGVRGSGDLGDWGSLRAEYGRTRATLSGSVFHESALEWRSPVFGDPRLGDQRVALRLEHSREPGARDNALFLRWLLRF